MVTLKLQSTEAKEEDSSSPSSAILPAAMQIQSQVIPGLGSILSIRAEIDDVCADMANFHRSEPDVVMAAVSAHGARLTEVIIRIQRIEVVKREWKPVREEAEKALGELKSQFSIASRLIAIRQMDFDLLRGQV